MSTQELGYILNKMYYKGAESKNTMIFLIGILYSSEIQKAASSSSLNNTVKEIINFSNAPCSYAREIKKAIDLAKFVEIKKEAIEIINHY